MLAGITGLVLSVGAHSQPWLYSEFGQRGPSNWGSISNGDGSPRYPDCNSEADGAEQSPVNIRAAEVSGSLEKLQFHYSSTEAWKVVSNQHTQKVEFTTSPGYFIDPALGDKRFNAVQLHLHAPSENAIGGGLFDMEIHIVHEADATHTGTSSKFSHAVIAIMFKAGSGHNPWLNNIIKKFSPLPLAINTLYTDPTATFDYRESTGVHPSINIIDIFPSNDYYTFDGSLTTPPCTEGVKWYVMAQPAPMSLGQLTAFKDVMKFSDELIEVGGAADPLVEFGNNRPLQPLNQRSVLLYQSTRHVTEQHLLPESADDDEDATNLGIVGTVTSGTALVLLVFYIIFASRCVPDNQQMVTTPDEAKDP